MNTWDEDDVNNINLINSSSDINISFDLNKMNAILIDYKKRFKSEIWQNEDYKWQAIKIFQDNWDIDAPNLSEMLNVSLKGTQNLLTSARRYAKGMLVEFAILFPDEVRSMFINLFDENIDVYERINAFISKSDELLARWKAIKNRPDGSLHYQNINAITTYLWLRYPDKYYIFKLSVIKSVAEKLGSSYVLKKGAYAENVRSFLKLYDEMRSILRQDKEIQNILNECLGADCYPDKSLNTLTTDFGYFAANYYQVQTDVDDVEEFDETDSDLYSQDWFPSITDYTPGISKHQWLDLLKNKNILGPVWGGVLAAFYEFGGAATCLQIANKYHKSASAISGNCTQLAKRIYNEIHCPLSVRQNGNKRYWPILFQGKKAGSDTPGNYIWKLRTELYEALSEINIMQYQWQIEDNSQAQYWWLVANPNMWSFSDIDVGECKDFSLYSTNGNKRRIFQNYLDAKVGDIVIGYESNPVKQIVALAHVAEAQDGESILIEKTESLENPIDYQELRKSEELTSMEFFANTRGTLFKLSEDEYSFIMDLIRENNPSEHIAAYDKYDETDFLHDVFMTKEKYNDLISILKLKKNIILQGAPGVGKTYAAKRLAYSLMGKKDDSHIELVQFHQNYTYEDFVMGYKPNDNGFELKNGIFYRFCQKASNQPDQDYFFIIDEINRGNMSKIFGELLMLIEKDYRGTKATLAYNGMSFSVPKNVYLIGMMNTADRSLAMIDYALRRRFGFFEMLPGFDSEGFISYQNDIGDDTFDEIISKICELNKEIASDKALGKGFCIGHSYFCNIDNCSDDLLESIIKYEIIPMLEEYWFDDETKLKRWSNTLLGLFNEQ